MLDRTELARRLKAARVATGLKQVEVAERLGIQQGSYAQYETGRRSPTVLMVYEMIEKLGLDPAILFPEFIPKP